MKNIGARVSEFETPSLKKPPSKGFFLNISHFPFGFQTPTVTICHQKTKTASQKRWVAWLFFDPTVSPKRKTDMSNGSNHHHEWRCIYFPLNMGKKISPSCHLSELRGCFFQKNPRPKMLPLANYKHDNVGRPRWYWSSRVQIWAFMSWSKWSDMGKTTPKKTVGLVISPQVKAIYLIYL